MGTGDQVRRQNNFRGQNISGSRNISGGEVKIILGVKIILWVKIILGVEIFLWVKIIFELESIHIKLSNRIFDLFLSCLEKNAPQMIGPS